MTINILVSPWRERSQIERYASIYAESYGLRATVERVADSRGNKRMLVVWRGTEKEFRESRLIRPAFRLPIQKRWIRSKFGCLGVIYVEGAGQLRFVIETAGYCISRNEVNEMACNAKLDELFLCWREAVFSPVDIEGQ